MVRGGTRPAATPRRRSVSGGRPPRRHPPKPFRRRAFRTFRDAFGGAGRRDVMKSRERGAAMARRQTARPLPAWVGDLPVFERTLANGFKALVLPRTHAPVVVCDLYYPVGSVDEPAGKIGPGALRRAHAVQGDRAVPQGADRPPGVRRGGAVERRDRRGLHPLLVRLPVRPLGAGAGDRGRPDARGDVRPPRGRGRAARHRRGARPRPRLAAGAARPDPPGRRLPPPPLPQPDPRLARRPGADRRRGPARLLPDRTTGPTAPSWWSSATSIPRRRWTGSRRTSATCPRARPDAPRRLVDEPRQMGRRDFTLDRVRIGRAGPARLAHRRRAAIPTARRSTCSRTC